MSERNAPKDPTAKGSSFYLFKNKEVVASPTEDGKAMQPIYLSDRRVCTFANLVGNIQDEHDNEKDLIEQKTDGSYIVDGLVDFSEIVELLELPVDTDSFETMNGFLISLLDKIPSEDENAKLQAYGYEFQVLKVEDKMIRRVLIQKETKSNQKEPELALDNKA